MSSCLHMNAWTFTATASPRAMASAFPFQLFAVNCAEHFALAPARLIAGVRMPDNVTLDSPQKMEDEAHAAARGNADGVEKWSTRKEEEWQILASAKKAGVRTCATKEELQPFPSPRRLPECSPTSRG